MDKIVKENFNEAIDHETAMSPVHEFKPLLLAVSWKIALYGSIATGTMVIRFSDIQGPSSFA